THTHTRTRTHRFFRHPNSAVSDATSLLPRTMTSSTLLFLSHIFSLPPSVSPFPSLTLPSFSFTLSFYCPTLCLSQSYTHTHTHTHTNTHTHTHTHTHTVHTHIIEDTIRRAKMLPTTENPRLEG